MFPEIIETKSIGDSQEKGYGIKNMEQEVTELTEKKLRFLCELLFKMSCPRRFLWDACALGVGLR